MTTPSCRTCKYAIAPNNVGCICDKTGGFHAGLEPCEDYRLDPIWKPKKVVK